MGEDRTVHLLNAYNSIPDSPEFEIVRSHLMWLCKEITGKKASSEALGNTFGALSCCPSCCQLWANGKFSLTIKPSGICGPRMVKILQKHSATPEKLNKIEQKLLKRHNTAVNKLVIKCHICQKEMVRSIRKPKAPKTPKPTVVDELQVLDSGTVKKKRKKKDIFAGLNVSAVMSASPSPIMKRKRIASTNQSTPIGSKTPVFPMGTNAANAAKTARKVNTTPQPVNSIQTSSPKTPKRKGSAKKKEQPLNPKQKMKALREEKHLEKILKKKEEWKSLSKQNATLQKNNRLQGFLANNSTELSMEERINSLLQ